MTALQAILTAILQGVTELFPVSSLGHAVILPRLLGWNFDQQAPEFLPFLVVLHLGTAAALLIYFWRDWVGLGLGLIGAAPDWARRQSWRLFGLIVVATVPAVVIGFALEKFLRHLFGSPVVAAAFLIVNGGVLFLAERLRRRNGEGQMGEMGWRNALMIGLWQSAALIPGISRSGTTMVGGLLAGLHHREAAHFSFLIATPIIFGAAVLEVPKLLHHEGGTSTGFGPVVWVAGIVAGITAYASIAFLMRYFGKHDLEALDPFAYYCWAFGALALGLILFVL
jgi:undecaprenyl-diphosphatase